MDTLNRIADALERSVSCDAAIHKHIVERDDRPEAHNGAVLDFWTGQAEDRKVPETIQADIGRLAKSVGFKVQ